MARYQAIIESTWSAQRVFEYMSHFDNAAEWDPGVRRAEHRGGGAIGVGSEFHLVTLFRGKEVPLTYRIIDFDSPWRVVLEARNSRIVSRDEVTVRETPTGSQVVYSADLSFRGLWVVLAPVLPRLFRVLGDAARAGLERTLA